MALNKNPSLSHHHYHVFQISCFGCISYFSNLDLQICILRTRALLYDSHHAISFMQAVIQARIMGSIGEYIQAKKREMEKGERKQTAEEVVEDDLPESDRKPGLIGTEKGSSLRTRLRNRRNVAKALGLANEDSSGHTGSEDEGEDGDTNRSLADPEPQELSGQGRGCIHKSIDLVFRRVDATQKIFLNSWSSSAARIPSTGANHPSTYQTPASNSARDEGVIVWPSEVLPRPRFLLAPWGGLLSRLATEVLRLHDHKYVSQ